MLPRGEGFSKAFPKAFPHKALRADFRHMMGCQARLQNRTTDKTPVGPFPRSALPKMSMDPVAASQGRPPITSAGAKSPSKVSVILGAASPRRVK